MSHAIEPGIRNRAIGPFFGIFSNYPGLVECYVSAKRHKEALTVAKNAHKTLGANPRTLTVRSSSCRFTSFSIASELTLLTEN